MMPYEKRAEDRNTRDIAVVADSKIDNHVEDCIRVRERIEAALGDIRSDLKRINWYIPLIVGGIAALHFALDFWVSIRK